MAPCGGMGDDRPLSNSDKPLIIKADVRKSARQSSLGIDVVLYTSYGQRHGIIIERVRDDGDIAAWNQHCVNERERLRAGDFIISVNGIKDDPSLMARELWAASELSIVVQRSTPTANNQSQQVDPLAMQWEPDVDRTEVQWRIVEAPEWAVGSLAFQAILNRQGGRRLGIDVLTSEAYGRLGLVVNELFTVGVVASWNEICPRDLRVMPGDCVIDVNGKTEPTSMLEEMRIKNDLIITFLRPSEPVPRPSATASSRNGGAGAGLMPRPPLDQELTRNNGNALAAAAAGFDVSSVQGKPLIFEVRLEKPAYSRLGITVLLVAGPTGGVVVTGVAEQGAMAEWNQRHKMPCQVQVGDYIVDVNGINAQNATLERMAKEFSKGAQQVVFTVERRVNHSAEVTELMETAIPPMHAEGPAAEGKGAASVAGQLPPGAALPSDLAQALDADIGGLPRRVPGAWPPQPPQGLQPHWAQGPLAANLREAQALSGAAAAADLPPWRANPASIGGANDPGAPPSLTAPLPYQAAQDPSLVQLLPAMSDEELGSLLAQALEQRGWLRPPQALPQERPRGFPRGPGGMGM
mmetsp:Transcript_55271/g.131800  ORF Transcript_55271/g.131800 Transcript_55271/m.131800 type:complete len:579 (-) Transcript_55271:129-1865(-)